MFKSPAQDMGIIKYSKEPVIFSTSYDSIIRTAFNMFKDKPLVGHGPKCLVSNVKMKNMQQELPLA